MRTKAKNRFFLERRPGPKQRKVCKGAEIPQQEQLDCELIPELAPEIKLNNPELVRALAVKVQQMVQLQMEIALEEHQKNASGNRQDSADS